MRTDLLSIAKKHNMETVAFSPENAEGKRAGGSRGADHEKICPCIGISPGETAVLIDTNGPGIIRSMWFTGDICQSLILRIFWDDLSYPSVEAPIGSFFGYGFPGITEDRSQTFPVLNSAMILVAPCRGMNCYWPMPFHRHCRLTITNRHPNRVCTMYYMITMDKGEIDEESMYFHASYRQELPVKTNRAYTIIDGVCGTGHFAGVSLAVGTNAPNGCWVEGEAKMYIDGDRYPTINYTGTEDYFCGAYAFGYDRGARLEYKPYSGLYAGMYAVLGSERQHYCYQPRFMLYRQHIPDPICFKENFCMTLQNIGTTPYGSRSRRDDFSSCAYWYQTTASSLQAVLPPDEDIFI